MRAVEVGIKVYNRRNLLKGVVVSSDEEIVNIDIEGVGIKSFTYNVFDKWWLPDDDTEQCGKTENKSAQLNIREGVAGTALFDKFINIIKSYDDESILIFFKTDKHCVVKCNDKAIFDITIGKKRLTVLSHPDSLTPDNMRRITKLYPKEWNQSLRARFTFLDMNIPLMKSIISDGIFYRKNL